MKKGIFVITLVTFLILSVQEKIYCQYHQEVLPDLTGIELLDALVNQYKPVNVLSYSQARRQMYTKIYNTNDSLECVYSGHKLYVSQNDPDPIQTLIMNGSPNGINCEHTFPQSMGAGDGNARSDMFHLYPCRSEVNSARGNYPFDEINDSSTDRWFINNTEQSFIPNANIDAFSEQIEGKFEPKETHKGNVARAMFYFFTMYKNQANASFFNQQKDVLCEWHLMDPVDSLEWFRAQEIALFQDGKVNPFILDCSLLKRSYCTESEDCEIISSSKAPFSKESVQIAVYPNPVDLYYVISFELNQPYQLKGTLLDISGRKVHQMINTNLFSGQYEITIEEGLSGLEPGFYLLYIELGSHSGEKIRHIERINKF